MLWWLKKKWEKFQDMSYSKLNNIYGEVESWFKSNNIKNYIPYQYEFLGSLKYSSLFSDLFSNG